MTTIRLKYIDRFVDRHGHVRYYFRRGRGARKPLPAEPHTREFRLAYEAMLNDEAIPVPAAAAKLVGEYSFQRLADLYYRSPAFLQLKPQTQRVYQLVLAPFLEKHGHRDVREMKRSHVNTIIGEKAATPAAANTLLKKLKGLIRHAFDLEWIAVDPTDKIKKFKEGEFHTWTEAEIAKFEAHWAIGTVQRTALALHLYTGQRRSDVHVMRWPEGGMFHFQQVKEDVVLDIPVHPELARVLAAWERKGDIIIYGAHGKPFADGSYGNMFGDACRAAGLPKECSSHGLRKAAARRLAEAGCTEKQIAAITGHTTLKEVARYTRKASQTLLARSAMSAITPNPEQGASQPAA